MAKGEKKISINTLESAMKAGGSNTVTVQWNEADIVVKKVLSIRDMLTFVSNVSDSCFSDEYGFMPEMLDFAIRSNALEIYANFNLPDNIERRYDLLYRTDAFDVVMEHVDHRQFDTLVDAIDRKIDYLCDMNISSINREVEKLVASMEELHNNAEKIFGGVDADDMKKIVSALASGGVDEKKLVDALVERKYPQSEAVAGTFEKEADAS